VRACGVGITGALCRRGCPLKVASVRAYRVIRKRFHCQILSLVAVALPGVTTPGLIEGSKVAYL
jgi:hypothetical protein